MGGKDGAVSQNIGEGSKFPPVGAKVQYSLID